MKNFGKKKGIAFSNQKDFSHGELSEYYEGKIIPTDMALDVLGIDIPDEFDWYGNTYVKGVNGYILKGMENNRDVKRGLYMLSIPSNFISKTLPAGIQILPPLLNKLTTGEPTKLTA